MSDLERRERIRIWRVRFDNMYMDVGTWLYHHLPAWLVAFILSGKDGRR